jgi:hypothetical protein
MLSVNGHRYDLWRHCEHRTYAASWSKCIMAVNTTGTWRWKSRTKIVDSPHFRRYGDHHRSRLCINYKQLQVSQTHLYHVRTQRIPQVHIFRICETHLKKFFASTRLWLSVRQRSPTRENFFARILLRNIYLITRLSHRGYEQYPRECLPSLQRVRKHQVHVNADRYVNKPYLF